MKQRGVKATSLKAKIKNIAKEKRVAPQLILQNFMMERFLNRIATSSYKDCFIIKGGSLISVILGIENRTTMDIDMTSRGFSFNEKNVQGIIQDISLIDLQDDTFFEIKKCEPIREDDAYGGFRVFIDGFYESKFLVVPFTIDITTGDVVTPEPQKRSWVNLCNAQESFELWTYTLETIVAEKIESILSKGVLNTRPRDFYDVYMLSKLKKFNGKRFSLALKKTCEHRKSWDQVKNAVEHFVDIENSGNLKQFWERYAKSNSYAANIGYNDIVAVIKNLLTAI